MKKVYVTITGMKYYYGFNPFSIGKKLTCKKEHNNPYDSEAIKVTMKNIGTVGYIANSPYTKANGTMGAGAVNKYVKKKIQNQSNVYDVNKNHLRSNRRFQE